jgi:hypothetical protein
VAAPRRYPPPDTQIVGLLAEARRLGRSFDEAHGQLGRDYPLGWARAIAFIVLLLGIPGLLVTAAVSRHPVAIGASVAVIVAMTVSGLIEVGKPDTSHNPAYVPPAASLKRCTDGSHPYENSWGEWVCGNYSIPE